MLTPHAPSAAPEQEWLDWQASQVVESALDAVVGCSRDATIQLFNASAERLYGHARQDVLGRPVSVLFADPGDATAVEHVLTGGAVDHVDTVHVRADASTVEVSVALSPVHEPSGAVGGLSLVAREISERRAVEREFARTRRLLEEHAAELARSNADLEEFAYVASHDLSEPLRTITGMLALLQAECAGRLGEDADDYVGRAVGGANRMRSLIDDLLRFSRIGRGAAPRETVELDAVLRAAVDSLGAAIGPGASVTADGPLPEVTADPGGLRQVLENLIANGLKFTQAGEPRVRVTALREPAAWRITVADNGIGIPREYAERVFGVFKRLHTRDAYPGTGIGLAITERIVERAGGRIWVEEHAGPGARVSFTIPDPPAAEPSA